MLFCENISNRLPGVNNLGIELFFLNFLSDGINSAYSLWSEAHAQAGQVAIAEWKEDHEHDVPGVMSEQHGKVVPGLHVTQNEEDNEYNSSQHQHRKPLAVFTRLKKQSTEKYYHQRSSAL